MSIEQRIMYSLQASYLRNLLGLTTPLLPEESWKVIYLHKDCFLFAKALAKFASVDKYVAIVCPRAPLQSTRESMHSVAQIGHLGVQIGNKIADARGLLTKSQFMNRFVGDGAYMQPVGQAEANLLAKGGNASDVQTAKLAVESVYSIINGVLQENPHPHLRPKYIWVPKR